MRLTFADIKAQLQPRVIELCRELLPDGRQNGNYWIARNPTRDDASAGSFYVWIKGIAAGAYRDDATGDKGDVIDLICYLSGLERGQAAEWAKSWLGISDNIDKKELKRRRVKTARRNEAAEKNAAAMDQKNASRAKALWLNCRPWTKGDPVWLYLAGRGIELDEAILPAHAIRYHLSLKHHPSGHEGPAMVVLMSNDKGEGVAVHRTWLTLDGHKADVSPQRMIWPKFHGCVARIAKGTSGKSPEEVARKKLASGPVVLTEGIEDALAIAIACPELRVWACGSLGNFGNVPALACCSRFIVMADNDVGLAVIAFQTAMQKLENSGLRVKVVRSWIGKDANDLLLGD